MAVGGMFFGDKRELQQTMSTIVCMSGVHVRERVIKHRQTRRAKCTYEMTVRCLRVRYVGAMSAGWAWHSNPSLHGLL